MYGRPLGCKRFLLRLRRVGRVQSCIRPVDAGMRPLALMKSADCAPHQRNALGLRHSLLQVPQPPVRDRFVIISLRRTLLFPSRLSPRRNGFQPAACYAAAGRYFSPRVIIAQTMRAVLAASATAATSGGRRANKPLNHCEARPAESRGLIFLAALPRT